MKTKVAEKKYFQFFSQIDVTSKRGRFNQIFFAQIQAEESSTILFFWFKVKRPLKLLEIEFDFLSKFKRRHKIENCAQTCIFMSADIHI